MTKLPQHGGFDPALEASMREELLAEFSEGEARAARIRQQSRDVAAYMMDAEEDFGEVMDAFDFGACQRPDGSVYGTSGQCRKGTPISVKPGEKMPDIVKKALGRGVKHKDIREVADEVRQKHGIRQIKGDEALKSVARRLDVRRGAIDDKPKDRPLQELGTRSLEKEQLMAGSRGLRARQEMVRRVLGEVPKPIAAPAPPPKPKREPKGEGTVAVDKKIRELQKGLARVRDLKQANAGNPQAADLYGRVEKSMQKQIKKLRDAGPETKAKAAGRPATPKTESSAPRRGVAVAKVDVVKRKEGNIHDVVVDGKRVGQMIKLPGDPRYQIRVGVGDNARLDLALGLGAARARARAMAREQAEGGAGQMNTVQAAAARLRARLRGEAPPPEAKARGARFETPEGVPGYNPRRDFESGGRRLGAGAMGEVRMTKGPPPGVTKEGRIGQFEAAAIKRLEGSGVTPKLHGVSIEGGARKVSSGLGGHVTEAKGYLGMGLADGKPLQGQVFKTRGQRMEAFNAYLDARKAIHTRGVAHNDMHSGNFFYDPKTKKGNLVDFGLAQISPKAALNEALGLSRGETMSKGDWQSAMVMKRFGYADASSTARYQRYLENRRNVERIMEEEGHKRFLNRNIRQSLSDHDSAAPKLTDQRAQELIQMLYDGV